MLRSLLEGKRPAETMVVRFSNGDEAILVVRCEAEDTRSSVACKTIS